ncbi:dnaJ homolog subfamily C member 2-like isoform X16 [Dreissena polymorpha]|nr:dnaJ homolog subfamily C member 2-like isoform X2 [Dreissena polymorpha]XP_052279772.1 dnaJ homolog subfamily C member 2-like isoform X3 [Dreissena polymorpha]XP_052279779.1 dnaJ homolog subfamily C member 2-like isoform X4 [Dreissena polymorpha]XP_052279789.1 dnaJ homolog subfamily C member 2-like isoform X5 [Dreissena polymorpha]XP_052279799.1 dnaJ homolog subfamily C member 2-like isoform X6 [Dreissena polymorpha]XP_052279801.1 dnaJ homolog subfamily C member 2-like isoform X7 [Dreissena
MLLKISSPEFNMILPLPTEDDITSVSNKLTACSKLEVEPVGRWFEALCLRRRHKHTLSQHSLTSSSSSESEDDLDDEQDEESLLLSLDPKEWKKQDHYAVLGLAKQRYKASDALIKKAYKKKVLHHHPDKRRARGLEVKDGEDDYFTCITRAWETLGIPAKRRAFDSVDPLFDDSVPPNNNNSKEKFYEVFRPVFVENARWSNKKRVPDIGDESSSFEEVNRFYTFWYDFDSWREFSYLDEEEKEKGENRDERRWIEKQNKAARQKRKKEEMTRIRQIVDNAYACDPRIARFKEEEKEKKASQKRAKQDAARQKQEEEDRKKREVEEVERKKKQEEEEKARQVAAAAKKEKEALKNKLKKERKTLRTTVKDYDFFATDEDERVSHMAELDKLAELLELTTLQTLNESLKSGDKEQAKQAFCAQIKDLNAKLEAEKLKQLEDMSGKSGGEKASKGGKPWSEQELQTLIKGVNVFPAGTKERWEVIANFIKQHVSGSDKNAKDVLAKAKELQKNDLALKSQASENAFQNFNKQSKRDTVAQPKEGVLSERMESVVEQQIREMGTNPAPWTTDEQKLLEQALKTFPASSADRWERIAEAVPTRSKKDCMMRYKELVELIRAKKAAQDATKKK